MKWFGTFVQDQINVAGGGSDAVPPVDTPVSPTPNTTPGTGGAFPAVYATAKDTPIVETVIDAASAIAFVSISVKFSDRQATEVVYHGKPSVDGVNGFLIPYRAFSTVTGSGAASIGHTFSIRRDDGWPSQQTSVTLVQLNVKAVDVFGNVLS